MTWEMDMKVIEKRMEKRMEKTISERLEKEYEEKYRKSVKEAEMEKSLEIAKNMLNDGIDIDKVARLTNLSLEEVAALR